MLTLLWLFSGNESAPKKTKYETEQQRHFLEMFTERQRYSLQKWNNKGKHGWMNNFPVRWVEEEDDDDEGKLYIDKEKKIH